MNELSDEILRGLAAGEPQAWRELVRAYGAPLLRYAAGITGDADSAQDVVQQVYVRIYRHRGKLVGGTLRALCYTTAGNLARDYLRRKKIRTRVQEPNLPTQPSPEHSALAREAWLAALALPAELREAVVLHFGHGLSHAEVAEVVGAPKGTVSTRLRRALETLREKLQYTALVAALPDTEHLGNLLAQHPDHSCAVPISSSIVSHLELIVMASIGKQGSTVLALWLLVLLLVGGGAFVWIDPLHTRGEPAAALTAKVELDTTEGPAPKVVPPAKAADPATAQTVAPKAEVAEQPVKPAPAPAEAPALRIIGTVAEHNGTAAAGARVTVSFSLGDGSETAVLQAVADSAGLYSVSLPLSEVPIGAETRLVVGVLATCAADMMGDASAPIFVSSHASTEHRIDVVVRPPLPLRFRVIDEAGSPIEGASVWWCVDNEPGTQPTGEKFLLTTDADGWAAISVPVLDRGHTFLHSPCVVAEAPNFCAQQYRVDYELDAVNEFVITLTGARTLEGRLVGSTGEPLAGLGFELELDPDDWTDQPVIVESLRGLLVTDHAGRFKIESFPAGGHPALVRAQGFHERECSANADQLMEVQLLRKSKTTLRILDAEGNPLPAWRHDIFSVAADGSVNKLSGAVGQFDHEISLEAYPPGKYRVEAGPAGWASIVSAEVEVTEADRVQELRASPPLDSCTLLGRTLGPDGQPVRAQLILQSASGARIAPALSATDGSFKFGSVPMGEYTLKASARSLAAAPIPVTLPRDEPVEIRFTATATMLIRLPAEKAAGLDRWEAEVFDSEGGKNSTQSWYNATPGLYRMTDLPPGETHVVVKSSQFCLWKYFAADPWQKTVQLKPGEVTEVVFESLPAHSVRLRVLGPDGLAFENESLDLKRVSPDEPDPGMYHGTIPSVFTDSNGELQTAWLLPGRYFFNAGQHTRVFFEVEDRPDQLIEIRVPPASGD